MNTGYHTQRNQGGVIGNVAPGSIAKDLNLQPGDRLLEINALRLRDSIDYHFAIAEEQVMLLVQTAAGQVLFEIEKDYDEDLGITFTTPLFTGTRTCANGCLFCFVKQLPKGMRDTLYLNDDDYRLSFLYGNFITLTNLRAEDWQRIEQQHLSPLYVSVHTTDHALRTALLGRRKAPNVLEQLRRLGAMGITVHTQIVACPGINDGAVLERTIADLAALYPTVQSIAVVPVGITRFSPSHQAITAPQSLTITPYTVAQSAQVLKIIKRFGNHCRHTLGVRLVYPGDEFVLMTGQKLPSEATYDDYPQYFNGVGMARDFCDRWQQVKRHLQTHHTPTNKQRIAWVSGTLFAPILQQIAEQINHLMGTSVTVVPVLNTFFGERVTVSGLLTGQDMVATLQQGTYDHAILPRGAFDHAGVHTLDDYHVPRIADETGIPLSVAGDPEELVQCMQSLAYMSST
jgi:putative radical SAM enzyme (TIGR03279 family)